MSDADGPSKWNWRAYLSPDEAALIAAVDEAKARWLALNSARASIKNRAVQRAMYDARNAVRRASPQSSARGKGTCA